MTPPKTNITPQIALIAFDADDTLWHNESLYLGAQAELRRLLAAYHPAEWIDQQLYETEMRNLRYFGYGLKGFTLSLIETAIELSNGRISGREIQRIIHLAKDILNADIQFLDHAQETVARLSHSHLLMLITKGDLFDQETKIARSGLGPSFKYVEIVSDKTPAVYQALLARYQVDPARFLMVGNSLRSDILPVLELGGRAVHIPYEHTWAHEKVSEAISGRPGYFELEHLGQLPALVERLDSQIS